MIKLKNCRVRDCFNEPQTKGLCNAHYLRMQRNGTYDYVIEMFRERTKHPHYQRWATIKHSGVTSEWLDFLVFIKDVGEKPSENARLRKIEYSKPYGPSNFRWVAIRTDEEKRARKNQVAARHYYGLKISGEAIWSRSQRDCYLKRKYGINLDQYEVLLKNQGGVCAICLKEDNKRLAVDHCHRTKVVRGLLCSSCNISIGRFGDDPERLQRAILYLTK